MRANDGSNQSRKTAFDFRASRSVMHFDIAPFGPDQAGFTQGLEMMRQGGFWDLLFSDVQEIGAVVGTA
jgi:hypothetical protein